MSCLQLEYCGEMGLGLMHCQGCRRLAGLRVMSSPAGYYLGTMDQGMPYCRATGYAIKGVVEIQLKQFKGIQ